MSFIVTATGDELDMHRPEPGHFNVLSIAWSLAQINRFNGHCIRPYSVAEHSLLVCEIAERELGVDIFGQLGALMHDAHEAFSGDMHSPGKHAIGDCWLGWESHWARHTHSAFAIVAISKVHAAHIHCADLIALATERRDLVSPLAQSPWPCLEGIEPVPWVNLYDTTRRAMNWEDWRDRWLDRYHELDFARNDRLFSATTEEQIN